VAAVPRGLKHLQGHQFKVVVKETEDLSSVKAQHHVPDELASCHTAVVEDYTIEGHVPAGEVKRLLAERRHGNCSPWNAGRLTWHGAWQ